MQEKYGKILDISCHSRAEKSYSSTGYRGKIISNCMHGFVIPVRKRKMYNSVHPCNTKQRVELERPSS
jgi:hypothetical protein